MHTVAIPLRMICDSASPEPKKTWHWKKFLGVKSTMAQFARQHSGQLCLYHKLFNVDFENQSINYCQIAIIDCVILNRTVHFEVK